MGNRGGVPPLLAWTRRVMDLATKLMQLILSDLRNTDRPITDYVWHAWFVMIIPSLPIVLIVFALFGPRLTQAELDARLPYMTSTMHGVMLVVGAWIETLVMWPVLFLLRRILGNTIWVPVVSGLIWAGLHFSGGQEWGVSKIWSFFILSVCFLEWEKKSKGLAILVTGLVHMISNMVGFLLMVWL